MGCYLYELLTGDKPFSSQFEQSALYSILNDEPDYSKFSKVAKKSYLKEIVSKCLKKKKEDRYDSISQFIESLEEKSSSKKNIALKYYHRKLTAIIISIIIFVLVGTFIYPIILKYLSTTSSSDKIRIAILPFNNSLDKEETKDLPIIIQSMLVSELSRIRQIGIIDPNSLNGFLLGSFDGLFEQSKINQNYKVLKELDASFIIDGAIIEEEDRHEIRVNIIEPKSTEIKFTYSNIYDSDSSFFKCIKEISNQIINYFYVESLLSGREEDLEPWVVSGF